MLLFIPHIHYDSSTVASHAAPRWNRLFADVPIINAPNHIHTSTDYALLYLDGQLSDGQQSLIGDIVSLLTRLLVMSTGRGCIACKGSLDTNFSLVSSPQPSMHVFRHIPGDPSIQGRTCRTGDVSAFVFGPSHTRRIPFIRTRTAPRASPHTR